MFASPDDGLERSIPTKELTVPTLPPMLANFGCRAIHLTRSTLTSAKPYGKVLWCHCSGIRSQPRRYVKLPGSPVTAKKLLRMSCALIYLAISLSS